MRCIATALTLTCAGCSGCGEPPPAPAGGYANDGNWAALPGRRDPADEVPPGAALEDGQAAAKADVFYVHPTTHETLFSFGNAALDDADANAGVDETLRFQASAFNGAARVFAPRYRQASLLALAVDDADGAASIERAYADVRAAFDEYVDKRSDGRPFLLAGHSQGSTMLIRLIRERLDGKPLQSRLVAAYLLGELVGTDTFTALRPCRTATETGCFVSWATARRGATPSLACGSRQLSDCAGATVHTEELPVVCVNPLTWTPGGAAGPDAHLGAGPGRGLGGGRFEGFATRAVGAACDAQGVLRIERDVDLAGVDDGDYHTQDVNLFYLDVRANVARRVAAFRPAAGR